MSFEASITFLITIFIFAITPGSGTFALLARALASGAKSCFSMVVGITISDLIYLNFAILGLASIAQNYGGLFTLIRFVGAAYLFYLGWKMWTASVETEIEKGKVNKNNWLSGLIQGFLISASNPKVILFYIAFLPTFMDLTTLTSSDIALVTLLNMIGLVAGLMLVSIGASSVRRQLKSPQALKKLNRTSGGIMIGAGAYLIASGSREA